MHPGRLSPSPSGGIREFLCKHTTRLEAPVAQAWQSEGTLLQPVRVPNWLRVCEYGGEDVEYGEWVLILTVGAWCSIRDIQFLWLDPSSHEEFCRYCVRQGNYSGKCPVFSMIVST